MEKTSTPKDLYNIELAQSQALHYEQLKARIVKGYQLSIYDNLFMEAYEKSQTINPKNDGE